MTQIISSNILAVNKLICIWFKISDDDLNFEYLHNFGPRFKKLADMYGEQPDSSDEDEEAIVNEEVDSIPRENLSHRHPYSTSNHQHRAGSHLSDRYDEHPQVNGFRYSTNF